MSQTVSTRRGVAVLAAAVLVAGALAASSAGAAAPLTKAKVKKIATKVANKRINALAPTLNVAHANTAGEANNVLWAVVDNPTGPGNIALVRAGQPGVSVSEGTYSEVNFGRDISQCAWLATRGAPGTDTEFAGWAQTHLGDTNTEVYVATRNEAGTNEDGDFHLLVVC